MFLYTPMYCLWYHKCICFGYSFGKSRWLPVTFWERAAIQVLMIIFSLSKPRIFEVIVYAFYHCAIPFLTPTFTSSQIYTKVDIITSTLNPRTSYWKIRNPVTSKYLYKNMKLFWNSRRFLLVVHYKLFMCSTGY